MMRKALLMLLVASALCLTAHADRIQRVHRKHHEFNIDTDVDSDSDASSAAVSSAHVVVSKEGPPPSPQQYTISKLEEPVVCSERGDATWKKWAKYDLDGVCARIQYYGEIEGQCETDCDLLCPQGFYEVAKEPCSGTGASIDHFTGAVSVHSSGGFYRRCVGRYKCTQSSYDYWVNMKWWQFLIWEVLIVTLGCCFFGLAVGCCIRCCSGDSRRRRAARNQGNQVQAQQRAPAQQAQPRRNQNQRPGPAQNQRSPQQRQAQPPRGNRGGPRGGDRQANAGAGAGADRV